MGLKRLSNNIHPDTEVVWQPNEGSQTFFVRCPFWEALYDGNRGPGKSDALLMAFAQHVGKGWGRALRGIVFRKQYKNLEELKVKGKRFFLPAFPGCKFLEGKSDYKFVFPGGEELLLRALEKDDDYWNYHGHEYCLAVGEAVSTPTGPRPIESLKVGDEVLTPIGARKVTRVFPRQRRECHEVSVYSADSRLIGQQRQSAEHQCLTNDGWLPIPLSGSLKTAHKHAQWSRHGPVCRRSRSYTHQRVDVPIFRLIDHKRDAQADGPGYSRDWRVVEVPHPYGASPMQTSLEVDHGYVESRSCGVLETIDIEVEEANCYFTPTGLLNKNCFIGFDELTTWPTDYLYQAMKACSRSATPGLPRMYRATTNPYGPGHGWVKSYWYDPAPGYDPTGMMMRDPRTGQIRARYTGDVLENKRLIEATPEYLDQLDSIKNEALRLAWRFGSWDIMVGGFWDGVWDPDKHIVAPFTPPVHWKHWRSLDWGYARPYSVNWYAMSPEGQIVMYRELYGYGGKENVGSREAASVVAQRITLLDKHERKYGAKFSLNPADNQIWQGHGTEKTIADYFRENGVVWIEAKKGPGSRINGWNAVRERLESRIPVAPEKGGGEVPGVVVTRDCKHFLRTFPVLMPDEDNWEDIDDEQEAHAADSFRYGLFSRHKVVRRKPSDDDAKRYNIIELPKPRMKRETPLGKRVK